MKINVFSYVYWPEFFLVNELAENLAEQGNEISVQTSLPNYTNGNLAEGYGFFKGPYFEKRNGVKIYRYPVVLRKKNFICLTLNYISNLVMGFLNFFRLPSSDVYFYFSSSPMLQILPIVVLKKITRKPLVIWYQDLWPETFFAVTGMNGQGFLGSVLGLLVKFIYRNTDLMLVQSPAFKNNLDKYGYRGPVEVIYNWAPEVATVSSDPEWMSELPIGKFIITFAGNIGKVQAIDSVLRAASLLKITLPEVFFAFVGDGSFLPEAQTLAQELGLNNVGFFGRKPVQDMPSLFRKSDALLVSLNDDPTLNAVVPSKVQAYMSSQKPLIAFLNGVGADIVRQANCGVVAPAEKPGELVKEIKKLLQMSDDEQKQLAENGFQFFNSHFTKEKTLKKIYQLLVGVVKNHR